MNENSLMSGCAPYGKFELSGKVGGCAVAVCGGGACDCSDIEYN
jgi:hypothetical protein